MVPPFCKSVELIHELSFQKGFWLKTTQYIQACSWNLWVFSKQTKKKLYHRIYKKLHYLKVNYRCCLSLSTLHFTGLNLFWQVPYHLEINLIIIIIIIHSTNCFHKYNPLYLCCDITEWCSLSPPWSWLLWERDQDARR